MNSTGGKYRWVIAALLLFSTTINYMDRQVISYLKEYYCTPVAKGGFGWTNLQYADVTSFFTGFYAVFTVIAGMLIDKIGTRIGLALSVAIWSVFGIVNAFAGSSFVVHVAIRSFFGLGEAGNFPSSIKTVAEWFPKKERALATGIFNSGSNLGAMLAALLVPWLLSFYGYSFGWKAAFVITGVTGFIWLMFWLTMYNSPKKSGRLSTLEFRYIHSDDKIMHMAASEDIALTRKIKWGQLFRYRQTWAFVTGKFLTDGVWWFLLFWLPDYLTKQFGIVGKEIILPTFIVYSVAIVGSVFGGSIPMIYIHKGREVYSSRIKAMFFIAICPLVLSMTQFFANKATFGGAAIFIVIPIICIGAAAHQAWSANLFTTVSDMFPKRAVASVVGIGGLAGGIGGIILQQLAGRLTDFYKNAQDHAYFIMFLICSVAYVMSWLIIKYLVPKFEPIIDLHT